MLNAVAAGVWAVTKPLRFMGIEMGARMTLVRVAERGLLVHSPVELDAATRHAVDELGTVQAIVAPNLFHHLHVNAWAEAYPNASVWCTPGLEAKRSDVKWSGKLGDVAEPDWHSELEQVLFSALPFSNEVMFFHKMSKTLICSDFMFNLANHPSMLTRTFARIAGKSPGPTLLERMMIKDRSAARAQVDRVLSWGAERIVLAHGDIVEASGSTHVQAGYAWL
jgi:hypothetical protein